MNRYSHSRRPDPRLAKKNLPKMAAKIPGPSPIPAKDPNAFPMRINKYLAFKGFATRRDADKLVERKVVLVNGRYAALGDKVEATDVVEVLRSKKPADYIYYAAYKPKGLTTLDTRKGQVGFARELPLKGVFPIGSLEVNTAGLLIFSNDRRLIDRLENPEHVHPRTYLIESKVPFRANFKEKIEAGVSLNGSPLIHAEVVMKSPVSCEITSSEIKNELRSICALFGADSVTITRKAILNVKLGAMTPGSYRKIEGLELEMFLRKLGL